jgi:hypothetical protein
MEELPSLPFAASGLIELIPLHARRGEFDAAAAVGREFEDIASSENEELRAAYATAMSEFLRADGRPAEALDSAMIAVAAAERIGLPAPAIKRGLVQAIEAAPGRGWSRRTSGRTAPGWPRAWPPRAARTTRSNPHSSRPRGPSARSPCRSTWR